VPAGLVFLCIVPVAAGTARLAMLATGGAITPENARFFAAPLPVVLHILAASVYGLVGALQFAEPLRRRGSYHRKAGRFVAVAGLTAAITGLWMTIVYPRAPGDSAALSAVRLVVGAAMLAGLVLGLRAARGGDFADHRAWMTRAYALALGAGTQALIHLAWLAVAPLPGQRGHTLLMVAGWAVNAAIAERTIRRWRAPRPTTTAMALQR